MSETVYYNGYKIGDRVRVKMSGVRGTLVQDLGEGIKERYQIQLDGAGKPACIWLNAKDIEKLTTAVSTQEPPEDKPVFVHVCKHDGPLVSLRPPLPVDFGEAGKERKQFALYSGLLLYFPAALARVAQHSFVSNEKHNPGQPLQHARGKSGDHLDCTLRHILDSSCRRGEARIKELTAAAWRILAELQESLERDGYLAAPAATFPSNKES